MITLYPYQQNLYNEVKRKFSNGIKRVICQLPTGGGKTVIFSKFTFDTLKRSKRVLIISDRIELLIQAGGTLTEFGINPIYITAGINRVPTSGNAFVAMTGTLKNRVTKKRDWEMWFKSMDLLIIDECHESIFNWIATYDSNFWKIGFTATPKRTGKMPQLSTEYDTIVKGLDIQHLINKNYLVYDKHYEVAGVDLTGVSKDSKGEYQTSEMFEKFNNTKTYKGLVTNWNKYAHGLCTLVFCVNIQHCIETAKELNANGIKAKFITSKPSKPNAPEPGAMKGAFTRYERKKSEYENYIENFEKYSGNREQIIAEWKRGDFHVLINAGIFTKGFDHKPVKCIVMYRATTSENLWLQCLGRGSRTFEGKTHFIILDFGDNGKRLGYYRQQREYSIHHDEAKSGGVPPSKECPKCKALVLASVQICEYCGFEFPKTEAEEVSELVEHTYIKQAYKEINFKEMSIKEIEEYARQKQYKKAWIWRQMYMKLTESELKDYARSKGYHHAWVQRVGKMFK